MRDVYTFTDRPCLTEHRVQFKPTVPHCSMATLIGLCIRVKLLRTLAPRFKVDIQVRVEGGRGGHRDSRSTYRWGGVLAR